MDLFAALLAAALALPAPWHPPGRAPETPEQYRERVHTIALAIATEAPTVDGWRWSTSDLAFAALVKMHAESGRFSLAVHTGKRRGDNGRSICLGQVQALPGVLSRDEWRRTVGVDLDATRRCSRAVMRYLALFQRCARGLKPSAYAMARIFAGYGTGRSCSAELGFARRRAALWWKVRPK